MNKPKYNSNVARIAGNIASGMMPTAIGPTTIAFYVVELARLIVAEVERTEPKDQP